MKPLPPVSATACERADGERVVGPRERHAVDHDQLAGRARARRRPARATACRTSRSSRPGRSRAPGSAVWSSPCSSTAVSSRSRIASAAVRAARIELNSPSVRPPAASTSASSSSSWAGPMPSRPGGGRCFGDVQHRLFRVVERAADVEPGPLGRVRPGQARGCGPPRRSVPPSSSVAEVSTTVRSPKSLLAQQAGHRDRGDVQHLAPARLVGQPDHVLVGAEQQPGRDVVHLLDAGPGHLPGAVGLLAAAGLERREQAPARCPGPGPAPPSAWAGRAGQPALGHAVQRRGQLVRALGSAAWSGSASPSAVAPRTSRPDCRAARSTIAAVSSSVIADVTRSTSSCPSSTRPRRARAAGSGRRTRRSPAGRGWSRRCRPAGSRPAPAR